MMKGLFLRLGIDHALFHALLTRVWQALSGVITLFMIVHFMPPTEQGFYYTFNSVLNLQIFFELGLSFVILQSTTHYFAFLQWGMKGEVTGNTTEREKLFTFLHKSFLGYLIAAVAFVALLIPAGWYFFGLRQQDAIGFSWASPWFFLVLGTSFNLCLTPFLAALEGSGKVTEIYSFRWKQFMMSNSIAWVVLCLGQGLFMAVAAVWSNALITLFWLLKTHKKFVIQVIKRPVNTHVFSWTKEVWPLQWRIAISWMSGYFISQAFTPLLFYYQGAVVSGQMGICLSLINMLSLFSLTWVSIRSPKMGHWVAHRDWFALDQLFSKIFWQSVIIFIVVSCFLGGVILVLRDYAFMKRLLPGEQIALLLCSMLFVHITSALSLYLRAHRVDPFMLYSVIGALLLAVSSWYGAAHYGSIGVCLSLLIVNGLYGFPSSIWLWQRCKHKWHSNKDRVHNREANQIEAYD